MNIRLHNKSVLSSFKASLGLMAQVVVLHAGLASVMAFDIDASSLGIAPFYRPFYGELTITPSPGVEESVVTYQGSTGVFDSSWVGKEFVAFRAHRNPDTQPPTGATYLGNIVSCRYATVTSVIDSKNLVVNFKFNGGNSVTPVATADGSGYFFQDCGAALKSAMTSIHNPASPNYGATGITFSPDVYVFKGLPGCDVNLTSFPLTLKSNTPGSKAQFKISTEDYYVKSVSSFFILNQGANDFTVDIELLPPHYSIPVVQGNAEYIINYSLSTQVARHVTVKNSACNSEQLALAGASLPDGANFVMPSWVYSASGGTRDSTDVTGFQVFTLDNAYWKTRSGTDIKNNNGGGNFMEIVDSAVIEDLDSKKVAYDDVDLNFAIDPTWGARNISIVSNNLCWDMVANQYWYGGTSNGQIEPNLVRIDGFDLYFGNNGDWQHILGYYPGSTGPANMSYGTKRLWDQIPQVGDTLSMEDKGGGKYFVYGWGIQVGDKVMVGSDLCTVVTRARTFYTVSTYYIHGWLVTLDKTLSAGNKTGVVQLSQTAYLLGSTRTGSLIYNRDAHGHLFYNRLEVGFSIRNSYLKGFHRGSSGKAAGEVGTGAELWQFPVVKEMINTVHESHGGINNVTEQFNSQVLKKRSDITGIPHRYLMDGGVGYLHRTSAAVDEIEVINRPSLIYGGASYGSPNVLDLLTDGQGVIAVSAVSPAMKVVAGGPGSVVDLSNTLLDSQGLVLYGEGTIILDNLDNAVVSGPAPSIQISSTTKLTVIGDGGRGGLRITAGTPTGNSITLTNWTLLPGAYIPTGFSSTWPALSGAITINGVPK